MVIRNRIRELIACCIFFLVLVGSHYSNAQEKTEATDIGIEVNKKKEGPKQKRILYIVKNDGKKILYGNRCFLDVQHAMGFEYLIQLKDQPLNRNELSRNVHNFGVKFILLFRNGPFWGIKIKKKKKECRMLSGDFVG